MIFHYTYIWAACLIKKKPLAERFLWAVSNNMWMEGNTDSFCFRQKTFLGKTLQQQQKNTPFRSWIIEIVENRKLEQFLDISQGSKEGVGEWEELETFWLMVKPRKHAD